MRCVESEQREVVADRERESEREWVSDRRAHLSAKSRARVQGRGDVQAQLPAGPDWGERPWRPRAQLYRTTTPSPTSQPHTLLQTVT